jgi:hypothetical protein
VAILKVLDAEDARKDESPSSFCEPLNRLPSFPCLLPASLNPTSTTNPPSFNINHLLRILHRNQSIHHSPRLFESMRQKYVSDITTTFDRTKLGSNSFEQCS